MTNMGNPKSFLARWSRRKRQAARASASAAAAPPLSEEQESVRTPTGEHAALPEASRVTTQDEARQENEVKQENQRGGKIDAATGFDLSQLPAVESITAATDIRPFLAPGVPAELARAALRRAWAADPAIRDHIGLSENSWDFNAPGAMPGFGPLEMTDALRQAVDQIVRGTAADKPAAAMEACPAENSSQQTTSGTPALAAAAVPRGGPAEDARKAADERSDESHKCDQMPQPAEGNVAPQYDARKREPPRVIVRNRHGGALPK